MQKSDAAHGDRPTGSCNAVPHSPFADDDHSPESANEISAHSSPAAEDMQQPTDVPHNAGGTAVNAEAPPPPAAPPAAAPAAGGPRPAHPSFPLPSDVVFRKNPDKDDMGYKAVLESITNPQTIMQFHGALRTTALVALPLFTIAVHPNTMMRLGYPQMMVAAVISTSTHQTSLGMQIGVHSWIWRGIVYMLVLGTIMTSWHVYLHTGAWYGMLALGIFLAGLVSHGMMRRFMYLYFFIFIIELKMLHMYFNEVPLNTAAWSAADFILGSVWGMAALCFPYPVLTKSLLDMIMAKIFEGFGKMFMAMITFVWLPDPHAACLFFNDRSPFMKIEGILEVMPPLLWFANWEPTEFPLHNPIRRLKLSLLRRVIALTYAAFGVGRTVTENRRRQSEQAAIHKIRVTLFEATQGRHLRRLTSLSAPQPSESSFIFPSATEMLHATDDVDDTTAPPQADNADSINTLRANSESCAKAFGLALMQCVMLLGTVINTPEHIVKKVPFEALREKQTQMRRALRLETLQVMKMQADLMAKRMAERQKQQQHEKKESCDCEEEIVVEDDNSPFGRTHRYTITREDAASILENKGELDQTTITTRLSELYFHALMAMIAGEIISFGEQMKDYKPDKSLGRRLLDFFIIEPWNGFWEDLWGILTLARPSDSRTVKDAIRMTCAYLSATALNLELYFLPGGEYYFGPTLLLGLPVEEESLGMAVNRMAGNALGCSLGFMAYHNTHNLAQQIAMVLCFLFVLRALKDHPAYGQMFLYSGAITMASMVTAPNTLQLMTRLITSNYTVVAYMLCCMFIFPNNNIKICWGYRCKLTKVMSEVIDGVALTVRIRPECLSSPALPDADEKGANEPDAYPRRNTEAMQMCSQLNVQMSLANRLLDMCDKWSPFAARQHVIRGMSPFPSAASTAIQFTHKRLMAHLRMLVFGVQLLHRPRTETLSSTTARLLSGSISDFLDEFAGCVRLVSQDFIDSLQASRKWSYPLTLSHTSQLSWLRVRLFAIHVECYTIAAQHLSKAVSGMRPEDYHALRQEGAERAQAEQQQQQRQPTAPLVETKEAVDNANAADPPLNMSFADRFLAARRQGESFAGGTGDTDAMVRLQDSLYLPQQRETSLFGPGGVSHRSFAHRVPLRESTAQPNDAFPFTQESAEHQEQQRLRDEAARRRGEPAGVAEGGDVAYESAAVADASGNIKPAGSSTVYDAVQPRKSRSKVSRLLLLPEEGPELAVPLYRGPAFTYVEDELATERDTDFSAVTTILCSCYGLIAELEGLTGSMNAVSTYQKELHESSLAIGLIDQLSARVTALRQRNYDRYHYPTPAEEQRRPLHAQSDPFVDWRF